jgi:hypothetical protein
LESEGIKIHFPDLHDLVPNSAITVGDLLNRPDDAMKTTIYAYKKNADNWWNWLNTLAPNGSIAQLKGYLDYLESLSDAKVDAIAIPKGQKKHKKTEYNESHEVWRHIRRHATKNERGGPAGHQVRRTRIRGAVGHVGHHQLAR